MLHLPYKKREKKHFKLGRSILRKPKQLKPVAIEIEETKDQPPYYVKGVQAGSKEEYWTGLALDKIEKLTGWGYSFQVPMNGGRRLRGGQVVDFIVETPGRKTIIDVRGRYWHTGHREDSASIEDLARKNLMNLIVLWTDQVFDEDTTYQFVKKELHV